MSSRTRHMSTKSSFTQRHGLLSDEQRGMAADLKRRVEAEGIGYIRLAWVDPFGASRAKLVTADAFASALESGHNILVATYTLDASGARVFSSFTRGGGLGIEEMTGSPNLIVVPDPATFRVLPWDESSFALAGKPATASTSRLGAVRHLLHQRQAVSVLPAATLEAPARAPCGARLAV